MLSLLAVTNLQDAGAEVNATIVEARSVMYDMKRGMGTVGRLFTDESLFNETTNA